MNIDLSDLAENVLNHSNFMYEAILKEAIRPGGEVSVSGTGIKRALLCWIDKYHVADQFPKNNREQIANDIAYKACNMNKFSFLIMREHAVMPSVLKKDFSTLSDVLLRLMYAKISEMRKVAENDPDQYAKIYAISDDLRLPFLVKKPVPTGNLVFQLASSIILSHRFKNHEFSEVKAVQIEFENPKDNPFDNLVIKSKQSITEQ